MGASDREPAERRRGLAADGVCHISLPSVANAEAVIAELSDEVVAGLTAMRWGDRGVRPPRQPPPQLERCAVPTTSSRRGQVRRPRTRTLSTATTRDGLRARSRGRLQQRRQ
jgi:hypothetical protein